MSQPGFTHLPVLYQEVLSAIEPMQGGTYLDGTLGGAGHSQGILNAVSGQACLYGIDRDQDALQVARERLASYPDVHLIHGNFHDAKLLLPTDLRFDGILLDLGVSSWQLDARERGFSYHEDAALDMRMDQSQGMTAAAWLNTSPEADIRQALYDYADETWAKRIAQIIVEMRQQQPFGTTQDLVRAVDRAIPKAVRRKDEGHPARRSFQAVRIAINDEIAPLRQALLDCVDLLKPGGRLLVISFHSIEDRIVKQTFQTLKNPCTCPPQLPLCVCHQKPSVSLPRGYPLSASKEELDSNTRARSARLRVAQKL